MWGSAYLLIAIALESFPPATVTGMRILLGALVLVAVPAARRTRVARADWPRLLLLGLLWMALPLTLFPLAQQSVDSSVAGMLTGAQPLLTAVVAAILLHRRPGRPQTFGLLVGFVGIALITVSSATAAQGTSVGGVLLIILAVACYAVAANIAVPLQQRYGGLAVILRALLVALVIVAPPALWSLRSITTDALQPGSVVAVVLLGTLSTGIAYVAFTTLLGRAGATRGSTATYLIPVVAVLLGVGIAADPLRPVALAGAALVLVGAWLTSRADH